MNECHVVQERISKLHICEKVGRVADRLSFIASYSSDRQSNKNIADRPLYNLLELKRLH